MISNDNFNIDLVSDAHVEGSYTKHKVLRNEEFVDEYKLKIVVNDEYEHEFSPRTKISASLAQESLEDVMATLNGGTFFFVNGALADYRDANYINRGGFVHDEGSIEKLAMYVGINTVQRMKGKTLAETNLSSYFTKQRGAPFNKEIELGGEAQTSEIQVPGMDEGGQFSSQLRFSWNPFRNTISSRVEIQRLWCLNGCYNTSPLLKKEVRVVNNWEEHLELARKVLSDSICELLEENMSRMSMIPATIQHVNILNREAQKRLAEAPSGITAMQLRSLREIEDITSSTRIREHYQQAGLGKLKEDVFETSGLAQQSASHITLFDVWNIATEMATHLPETRSSQNAFLTRFANKIAFDDSQNIREFKVVKPSFSVSDVERAFFGEDFKIA